MSTLRNQYYAYSNYVSGYSSSLVIVLPEDSPPTSNTESILIPRLSYKCAEEIGWFQDFMSLILEGRELGLLENAIVHGSFGDMTYTNYSDLDVTLHIKDKVAHSLIETKRFRKWVLKRFFPFMLSVDPLQHHGPFVLWDSLMANYTEGILPLCVYSRCWAAFETNLIFKTKNTPEVSGPTQLSIITCDALTNARRRFFKNGYNMFSIKRYLSNLMLVPAFFYTDQNSPTLKSNSFDPFYLRFGEASLAIQYATEMRKQWPKTPEWVGRASAMPCRFKKQALPHLLSRIAYCDAMVKHELIKKVIPETPKLCRAIRNAIENKE